MATKRSLMTLDDVRKLTVDKYSKSPTLDLSAKKNSIDYDGEQFILKNGKKTKRISMTGINNLVKVLNLPSSLPNKLVSDPDLMKYILNERSKKANMLFRTLDKSDSVVSFINNEEDIITNSELIESVGNAIKAPMFDKVHINNDNISSFTIVSTKGKDLRVGNDKFYNGVRVENNPLRSASTKIESYLERLICLNGQIAPAVYWSAPKHIKGEVEGWVQESVEKAMDVGRGMFKSIEKLADNKIDANLMDFLETMYDQLKVPENVRDLITRRIVKEGAENMYDIFNHITYVASNYKAIREDDALSARLMRIGGHFAQHIQDICNSCNRPTFANA